eukprot:CAMPEP_0174854490 /NCGR_PEP_ID=MMETSP1114-20130205/31326_1 /TAXON_ID=312471 /ORGANISM="Neobodo designis, Strain CCAP 1951/1" /LENGTH=253 /DNA_ID=CAMNT_0016089185 /DNA_START=41 /DNA_END=802 /DNA_ORIENTATION=+
MGGNNSKASRPPPKRGERKQPPAKPSAQPTTSASKAGGELTSTDEAILSLKEQRDDLERAARRSRKLAKKLDARARECLRVKPPEREAALRLVKRKRLYEERIKRIAAMQDNVEEMLNAVETAQFETRVASSLREGGAALEALVKEMGDVEAAMDRAADAVADAQNIGSLLGQPVGAAGTAAGIELDDEELEAELDRLVADGSRTQTSPAATEPAVPTLPAVPSHEIGPAKEPVAATDAQETKERPARQLAAA